MSEIEEAVKNAIERQIGDEGIVAQDGYSVKVDAWLDLDVIARAAIDAYESAKREAEKPYIIYVKDGVTHWSDGLCSPSVPGSKKFAEEQIRALNPFDEERMRPREDKLNWERPE